MERADPVTSGMSVCRYQSALEHAAPLAWLRQEPADDPAAGSTALCYLPAAAALELPSPLTLTEVLVLGGKARLGDDTLSPGDFTWYPAGAQSTCLEAIADADATLLLVLNALSVPFGTSDYVRRRSNTLHATWGYASSQDGTDRLPLRIERTRGELTWLLRYPAGFSGCPTRAENVVIEGLVLAGAVTLPTPEREPLTLAEWDYLQVPAGATPAPWHTEGGCTLLLRTIASAPRDVSP